ncbi:hypothetical protein KAH43_06980, partial [Candidatus Bipolaricaulota bacterium]|nr:hypothetical protein [Candidatus Bipolaricaulota bacterium]
DLDEGGWTDQDFTVVGTLGAFTVTLALGFDPVIPAFDVWNTTVDVALAGADFGADFTLADQDVEFVLTGSGVAGDVAIRVEVSFGGIARTLLGEVIPGGNNDECDLDWANLEITLGFPLCCTLLESTVTFDCDGFQNIVLIAEGIIIPNLPFLLLDASLEFTLQTKILTLSPRFDFGTTACFDIYIEQASTTGVGPGTVVTLDSITIEGIGLSCDIGTVTFTGLSFWGTVEELTDKPGLLSGTPYWEVYAIRSNEDACCGPFGFDVAVYFLDVSAMLFDVSLIEADMTLQIASQFIFNMGMVVDVEIGAFTEWVVGFLVVW